MALSVAPMEKMRDDDADHDGELLLPGSGSDEVAGLEVLRGVAGVGGGDADDPPMVMARAPKAGAVQPLTRKMAAVAMRVAMVMPETGEALTSRRCRRCGRRR